MTNIRRYFKPGDICFVTCVTNQRVSILADNAAILRNSIDVVMAKHTCEIVAWVILPDHFHLLIDSRDCHIPGIIRKIKLSFVGKIKLSGVKAPARVWQHRYWDHIIRDQSDLNKHIDYIHYNPVKHGLVRKPADYAESSFMDFRSRHIYSDDWGVNEHLEFDGCFGE